MRATRIPISSPLITVPTTWPRSCSRASEELIGTITWAIAEVTPATPIAAANTAKLGATAAATSATAVSASVAVIIRRRSSRSPSGTSSDSPST